MVHKVCVEMSILEMKMCAVILRFFIAYGKNRDALSPDEEQAFQRTIDRLEEGIARASRSPADGFHGTTIHGDDMIAAAREGKAPYTADSCPRSGQTYGDEL